MQILSSLSPLALEHEGGTAVAMGFFDGIHIGHRAVISPRLDFTDVRVPAENILGKPGDGVLHQVGIAGILQQHPLHPL